MYSSPQSFTAIIPAGGAGSRFGAERPKQYTCLAGKTVLEHSLALFLNNRFIKRVVVAIAKDDKYFHELDIHHPKLSIADAGKTRFESVFNAVQTLKSLPTNDWVLVHDAARCCLHLQDLNRLLHELCDDEVGGILAEPMIDTVKQHCNYVIERTLDRSQLAKALTPQMFRFGLLYQALRTCFAQNFIPTDEAQAVEQLGFKIKLILAEYPNPKLTHTKDLPLFERLLCLNTAQSNVPV